LRKALPRGLEESAPPPVAEKGSLARQARECPTWSGDLFRRRRIRLGRKIRREGRRVLAGEPIKKKASFDAFFYFFFDVDILLLIRIAFPDRYSFIDSSQQAFPS